MRIQGTGTTTQSKSIKKTTTQKSQSSDFGAMVSDSVSETASSGHAQSLESLDSLLILQQVDERENRRQALHSGDDLLDDLARMRSALLGGNVSEKQLIELERKVNDLQILKDKQSFADPRLFEVLSDIQLRVQVELAKYAYQS